MGTISTERRLLVPMLARSTDEAHRTASQLELLFDLTFVVAASKLTVALAHGVASGHAGSTVVPFLQVFFAVWWAWMNVTWLASAYDTDDVAYRLLTLVQMAGVLVLASGVSAAMDEGRYLTVTLGYAVMRIGLVALWLRVAVDDPPRRRTALRYAAGVSVLLLAWLLRHAVVGVVPEATHTPIFLVLAALELAVPWWAERAGATTWNPHHIAERYGLFAIILFGEGIFAASTAVDEVLVRTGLTVPFATIALGGLVLVFALWWLYVVQPRGDGLVLHRRSSYRWGYGHYGVFASLVALGAGLEVAIEQAGHPVEGSDVVVAYAVAIPVATFLALLWVVHRPIVDEPVLRPAAVVGGGALCLLLPLAVPVVGVAGVVGGLALVATSLVAATVVTRPGPGRATPPATPVGR